MAYCLIVKVAAYRLFVKVAVYCLSVCLSLCLVDRLFVFVSLIVSLLDFSSVRLFFLCLFVYDVYLSIYLST